MPDPVLSRELKSLQEELSTSQRERLSPSADRPIVSVGPAAGGATAAPAGPPKNSAEDQYLREQLHDFVSEITRFFEDVEKNISAHPTESVVGAMLMGILIGRLLGRR